MIGPPRKSAANWFSFIKAVANELFAGANILHMLVSDASHPITNQRAEN